MRGAAFVGILAACTILAACSDKTVTDTDLQAQAVALTPTQTAVVASSRLLTCAKREVGVACFTCEITMHDRNDVGIVTNATYFKHEFSVDDNIYKHSLSTKLSDRKFTSRKRTLLSAKSKFVAASRWCAERGLGTNYMIKDEMVKVFGEKP